MDLPEAIDHPAMRFLITEIEKGFATLHQKIDTKFATLDEKIDTVHANMDEKFQDLRTVVDNMQVSINNMSTRIDLLGEEVRVINNRSRSRYVPRSYDPSSKTLIWIRDENAERKELNAAA